MGRRLPGVDSRGCRQRPVSITRCGFMTRGDHLVDGAAALSPGTSAIPQLQHQTQHWYLKPPAQSTSSPSGKTMPESGTLPRSTPACHAGLFPAAPGTGRCWPKFAFRSEPIPAAAAAGDATWKPRNGYRRSYQTATWIKRSRRTNAFGGRRKRRCHGRLDQGVRLRAQSSCGDKPDGPWARRLHRHVVRVIAPAVRCGS